jgi:ADP-heptose:LPS heptosyltransferase
MKRDWSDCKNILCIRADNMGDLLMSSPAIRALKETFHCRITLLTSGMASPIWKYLEEVDDVIIFDLPWIKKNHEADPKSVLDLIDIIKSKQFDGAVIFNVYSQNPLPAAMLIYLAGVPKTLAYCRENPYELLTDWVPDNEPYTSIFHQVRRDLKLVKTVGAHTVNEKLNLHINQQVWTDVKTKLSLRGLNIKKSWLLLHPGVSEKKRELPSECWIEAGQKLTRELHQQVILTGSTADKQLVDHLAAGIGKDAFPMAGVFTIEEFISLIKHAPLLVSVNSAPAHFAAAMSTPVLVLYALTNPQHLPWKATGRALFFDVPESLTSKNEVIRYVNEKIIDHLIETVSPGNIVSAVKEILSGVHSKIPEMIPLKNMFGN